MQSFILMQSTSKSLEKGLNRGGGVWGGGSNFWGSFLKKCPFWPISNTPIELYIYIYIYISRVFRQSGTSIKLTPTKEDF